MASAFLMPSDKLLALLRVHNVCKNIFSVLFMLPSPVRDARRQNCIWSYNLSLWGARNSFSLLNPAGQCWVFSFDFSTSFLYLGYVRYDAAPAESLLRWSCAWQLWLAAVCSVLMNLLCCTFKDVFFKILLIWKSLCSIVVSCSSVVVLEKLYTSSCA